MSYPHPTPNDAPQGGHEPLTPAQIEVRRRLGVLMDPLQAARHLAQAEALRRGGVR